MTKSLIVITLTKLFETFAVENSNCRNKRNIFIIAFVYILGNLEEFYEFSFECI